MLGRNVFPVNVTLLNPIEMNHTYSFGNVTIVKSENCPEMKVNSFILYDPLCSINFQNVKLRPKIEFYSSVEKNISATQVLREFNFGRI